MGEPLFFINRKHTYCGGPGLFHYISDNSLEITLVSLETQNNSLKPITTFLEIKIHWIYYLVAEFYEDQILALLYSVSWCSTQELARQNKSLHRYYIMGSFILNLSLKDNWKKKNPSVTFPYKNITHLSDWGNSWSAGSWTLRKSERY